MRIVHPDVEAREIADLHSHCPFPVSNNLLRQMVRRSNPSLVGAALREAGVLYDLAQRRWSPALCKRGLVRVWKEVSGQSTTPDAVAGASAPASRTAKEPMRLTKREAAKLLHVSESTLLRRTKSGRYQCVRKGTGQWAKVEYTYQGIGLTEPAPPAPIAVPVPAVTVVQPEPEPAQEQDSVQLAGFQDDGSFVDPQGHVLQHDEGSSEYYDTGRTVIIEAQCAVTPDRRTFSRDGWEYQRNAQGKLYRTGARRAIGCYMPLSESASDSVVKHPFSMQRSNAPKEQNVGKAIWDFGRRNQCD